MKLRITYTPKDSDSQVWELDPEDMDNLESEALEVVGGEAWDSFGQWFFLIARGNMRAIRALLWVFLKRGQPDLDFNEVRFRTSELSLEVLEDEPVGKDETAEDDTDSPSAPQDSPAVSES